MKLSCLGKITAVLVMIANISTAQITKKFEARYAETGYTDDSGEQVIIDSNGNSLILAHAGYDALLIKYNTSGNLIWSFQAGRGVFVENQAEQARDFKIDTQGNVYLAINGYDKDYTPSICLIKINPNGEQVWQRVIPNKQDRANVVLALHENGTAYILCQSGNYGGSLIKVNNAGVVEWTKTYSSSGDMLYIQNVNIVNDKVVVWYYTAFQPGLRKSFLHVYNFDGTVAWKHEYKYNTAGTHISALQHHAGELYVAYFIDDRNNNSHRIIRYNMADGGVVGEFSFYMDNVFYSDVPLTCMFVGADDHIYVMGEQRLNVKKFTSQGLLIWTYTYGSAHYEVVDYVFHKETSTADILLHTDNLNGTHNYSIVAFKPNQTNSVLTNMSTLKPNKLPNAFAENGNQIVVVGSFKNGDYLNDITTLKFTTSNTYVWEAAPPTIVNSLKNYPTCITEDANGNTYVGGKLWLDIYNYCFGVIKYGPDGNQLWAKKLAPEGITKMMVAGIAVNSSGEVVVTGGGKDVSSFINESPKEMYVIKLDANGNTLWTSKSLNGITDDYLFGYQVMFDKDNNIYVLGTNQNEEQSTRRTMAFLKFDKNGVLKWERRFSNYIGYSLSDPGPVPLLRILNNEFYIVNKGSVVYDAWNSDYAMEIRKFSIDGVETLIKQFINTSTSAPYNPLDFNFDSSGNIYLLSTLGYFNQGFRTNFHVLSPTGEILGEKIWTNTNTTFPHDGAVAVNSSNQAYVVTSTSTEFKYSKLSMTGEVLWSKNEPMNGYSSKLGNPAFVFLTTAKNPVFLSTNQNEEDSNYFFITERDKNSGEIINTEIFDEIYDSYPTNSLENLPGDQLISFFNSKNSNDFSITGTIQDKEGWAETIVTLKYSVNAEDEILQAPASVTASDGLIGKVQVSWELADLSLYSRVYRNDSNDATTALPLEDWRLGTTYDDVNIVLGKRYFYFVRVARDVNGTDPSPLSLGDEGYSFLPAPFNLIASDGLEGKIQISWTTFGSLPYSRVYRNTFNDIGTALPITGWKDATTYEDTSIEPGQHYFYFVRVASDINGTNPSPPSLGDEGFASLPPPYNLTASDGLEGKIRISWASFVTLPYSRVYRNTSDDVNTALPITGWMNATKYEDTAVEPGQHYFYFVRIASNINGTNPSPPSASDKGYASEIVTAIIPETENVFAVHPNPVINSLQLKILRPMSNTVLLRIINVLGKTVYSQTIDDSSEYSIDFASYPAGQYLIIIGDKNANFTRKVIKH